MQRAVVAFLSEDQRTATRRVVNLSAQLTPCGARFCDVVIFDISTDGFKAAISGDVRVDDQAWVQLPGLTPVAGKVMWAKGGDAGFSFIEPLSAAALDRVRGSGPRTWPVGHFGVQSRNDAAR